MGVEDKTMDEAVQTAQTAGAAGPGENTPKKPKWRFVAGTAAAIAVALCVLAGVYFLTGTGGDTQTAQTEEMSGEEFLLTLSEGTNEISSAVALTSPLTISGDMTFSGDGVIMAADNFSAGAGCPKTSRF
ncbi:MAG: hypothetical protein LUE90_02335 [Clostridiales bacterium]|nr:hypothetical protein [Clostridiales bacterium]